MFFRELRSFVGARANWLLFGLLILLGILPPLRLGSTFLDRAYLMAYSLFAIILTSPLVTNSFASPSERELLFNEHGPDPKNTAFAKITASALVAWIAFLIILGTAFAMALNSRAETARGYGGVPYRLLIAPAIAGLALAVITASAGSGIALTASTPSLAQRLLRQGFFFLLLLFVIVPRFVPSLMAPLLGLLDSSEIVRNSILLLVLALAIFGIAVHKTAQSIEEQRKGLHIV